MKKDFKLKINNINASIEFPYVLTDKIINIYKNKNLNIYLEKLDDQEEALERHKSNNVPKHLINKIKRTLYNPNIILEINNYQLKDKNINIKNENININYENEDKWQDFYNYVSNIYNNFVKALYIIKQNRGVLYLNENFNYGLSKKLNNWNISINKGNHWNGPIRFEPEIVFWLTEFSKKVNLKICLNENDLKSLNNFVLYNPSWNLYWEYILLAENHFKNENYRMAIIELDIALEVILKEYFQDYYEIMDEVFDYMTKDISTGDLLKCAKFIYPNKNKFQENIKVLSSLHNTRNTILHRYQRNIKKTHIQLFKDAIESLMILIDSIKEK